ncbi:3-phosphoshikimate 1-carboxyvinyltransferase [Mangrovimonas aestuarii]|uniref:3-phosphoshikimate 1-carboxyvinyltransferase n=1 Tax=Mangrovimonas aestuarii TaxID=3018443 RepID=UPI002379F5A3|nr:3-phosphoshikimate 1-carboxyvinyltransferase [Mangrovimonas aestuarii]
MDVLINKSKLKSGQSIVLSGSKSESNRLLVLQALYPQIKIEHLSSSEDTQVMLKALGTDFNKIDVRHAGTAMRFLTAYFAVQNGREVVLTGSERMQERPIGILIDALRKLGAQIEYLREEGYPPLKIKGSELSKYKVTLNAEVSSQFISALMLIAPKLKNGLEIILEGEVTSRPYLDMTIRLLGSIGVETSFKDNTIEISPMKEIKGSVSVTVESDWSSASYFYSFIALSSVGTFLNLRSFKEDSLQGDSALVDIYSQFGVKTTFQKGTIRIEKVSNSVKHFSLNLNKTPDIAQTIAVTCLGLGVGCELYGLQTLKIKETNRLTALKAEMEKFGAIVEIYDSSLTLKPSEQLVDNVSVSTYNDHRMAMAFAPLALRVPIVVEDATVVVKSYPNFWEHIQSLGIDCETI